MITRRTLPAVTLIVLLAIAVVAWSRLTPGLRPEMNERLLDALSSTFGRSRDITDVKEALDSGADPNAIAFADGKPYMTALMVAVSNGNQAAARALLDRGANPNLTAYRGTALHVAIEQGNHEMIDLLMSRGADINARNGLGQTPLMVAASCDRPVTVAHLLKLKPDPSLKDKQGFTALGTTKRDRHKQVEAVLRQAGILE